MKNLSKEYDDKFWRTLSRDFVVLMLISYTCAFGIVAVLYYSVKYGW